MKINNQMINKVKTYCKKHIILSMKKIKSMFHQNKKNHLMDKNHFIFKKMIFLISIQLLNYKIN